MHCTCTVQNTMFVPPYIFISRTLQFCFWRRAGTFYISAPCKAHSSDLQFLPTCGANAAMLLLCLWVAALKMKACLNWGFGTCKREFVQACVCTSINEKTNLLRLCLVGSKFEAASVLGLSFWQMQKGIGSSLYLHIHKPKNLPHSVRERFFGLRMCKHKLEQTTFCTCHNLNPNTLSSSKLLPSKQRSTIFFCLWLCKRKLEQIPFCTCHNPNPKTRSSSQLLPTNKECASTPPEAELHKLCFAQCTHSARYSACHTVHGHKTL